uniref:JmjC domain-containing protein n=1 Tax=Ascaris lumbricoides TaxID=6252 RepID=A0A0M3I5K6_ASCLU
MEPFVLRGYINDWPAMKWTLESLNEVVRPSSSTEHLEIRFGAKKHVRGKILFENESRRVSISDLSTMVKWFIGDLPLITNDGHVIRSDTYWAYFDYKYIFEVLQSQRISDINWRIFGVNVNPIDSTIWIGTPGAYTPCHFDSYGFNLHAQLKGAKRWILIEPQEDMKPTRIPYEESTVFSRVDVVGGEAYLRNVRLRMVTLKAGDVLFVPPGWWHSVQCVTPDGCNANSKDAISLSVNTWIPVPLFDRIGRVREATTCTLVSLLTEGELMTDGDLCPSESSSICLQESMEQLKTVVDDLKKNCEVDRISEGNEANCTSDGQPTCKRAKCNKNDDDYEVAIMSREKDAGELHEFLRRYETNGIVVPSVTYEDLLKELKNGPLELVDEDYSSDTKDGSIPESDISMQQRRFIDALTCPETVQAIIDHMLEWEH